MEEEMNGEIETNNVPRIEGTLRWITYVSWLLGVGIARPKNCAKIITVLCRFVHFGICSTIVAYGAIDFFTFGNIFKSDIFKIMYYTNKVTCYISSYYYVCHGLIDHDKWPELMKKIQLIDDRIRKEIAINDNPIIVRQLVALLVTFLLGPLSLVIHAVYYYLLQPDDLFASDLLLYYSIAQSMINSFVYDVVIYIIDYRFQIVNKLIESLDVDALTSTWIALKVRRIRELHHGLCDLVTLVNNIYGLQLLMCSANSFTMVVATLFRIYMGVVEKNYQFMLINNIIWIIYTGQFALICWVCTLACRESNGTGILLQATILKRNPLLSECQTNKFQTSSLRCYRDPNNDGQSNTRQIAHINFGLVDNSSNGAIGWDHVRNEVNDFTTQLTIHRVLFTACDFFEMNNVLLTGFIGVITTYLIILVQFYRPEKM